MILMVISEVLLRVTLVGSKGSLALAQLCHSGVKAEERVTRAMKMMRAFIWCEIWVLISFSFISKLRKHEFISGASHLEA